MVTLLAVYAFTLAPGVTFWDAGEFISAAYGFGIPHPPGTPLYVALGRVWLETAGLVLGAARAMNLLSALATCAASGSVVWLVAREKAGDQVRVRGTSNRAWGALAAALLAGLATSVWANATETEVYAVSLFHVMVLLLAAERSGAAVRGRDQWTLLTAYLIALAPAVHLSALVGVPAAILLACREQEGNWRWDRAALLGGMLVASAGAGRMSAPIVIAGAVVMLASPFVGRVERSGWQKRLVAALPALVLLAIASSALLILLLRARHDPALNQGNPSTMTALADVVARRQYDVASPWPRRAPVWLQIANVVQYMDWQFAMGWGHSVFTTPARVAATLIYLLLGVVGWRAMRRDDLRLSHALLMLFVCGTAGVCVYLNLEAGASIGYGIVPAGAHEARERDYFFVLGFWAWAIFAGYGAWALVRQRWWPQWTALSAALIPLVANGPVNDRAHGAAADAPRVVAAALLASSPHNAVLFTAGDNDSYPLWYLQQVEGVRRDVTPVTVPLLPAAWYVAEVRRRTRLTWPDSAYVPGAKWRHEEVAALIAAAARAAGRPVAVSPNLARVERDLLGGSWALQGNVFVAAGPRNGSNEVPRVEAANAVGRPVRASPPQRWPDDVTNVMLRLLDCPDLGQRRAGTSRRRDSLEVTCNFR